MDDFRLRVFITAAKTLNFTKCAEQLYISQPAVSKHIGELESRYKVQLFERSGSRLALTEAGITLHLAEDGMHGLEVLEGISPDAIISDINMPRLDGFGFIEAELARDGRTPDQSTLEEMDRLWDAAKVAEKPAT